jgi:hypothetical protein
LNEGITPLPFVTRSTTSDFGGFASSRFGPTVPVAPASFSVWQLVHPAVVKTCLPCATRLPPPPVVVVACVVVAWVVVAWVVVAGRRGRCGRRRGRAAGRETGYGRDVGRDVVGVVAGDELGRHALDGLLRAAGARLDPGRVRDRVEDLVVDDVANARLLEPLRPRPGEGVVEVGSDLALRSGVGERVAGAALLDEELLAVSSVGAPARDATRAAAGREERYGEPRAECLRAAVLQPLGSEVHDVVSSSR